MQKRILMLLGVLDLWTGASWAQNKLLASPARKLQLAEFAISYLYVD